MKNFALVLSLAFLMACSSSEQPAASSRAAPVTAAKLVGGGWSPSVSGVSTANNKNTATISKSTITVSNAPMVRFTDGWSGNEVTVDLGNLSGFGANGSLTLVADATDYPFSGGAYPVLSSFSVVPSGGGATIEFVNVTATCGSAGMWNCVGGSCSANTGCSVQSPSSFFNRVDWDQHQVPPYGYTTTNSFPKCDASVNSWTGCPTNQNTLPDGHYYAKYVMMSDRSSSLNGATVGLSVKVTTKKDSVARAFTAGNGGAVNLNVILVGDKNVNDSHTAMGAQNLNLLFQEVNSILQTNANLGVGNIQVYDWTNANGGDQYSSVDYSSLGTLFASGSKGLPASDEGNYLNIFIVSDIGYSGSGFIILGLSGAILGPNANGTFTSGLAFSTSDQLATFNPGCALGASCARGYLENDFLEMGETIAHEMGHFLGLNHPSEKAGTGGTQTHDALTDTPQCAARISGASYVLDARACYVSDTSAQTGVGSGTSCKSACDTEISGGAYLGSSSSSGLIDSATGFNMDMPVHFCPNTKECQFNHTMWYTTKNRKLSSGVSWGGTWAEDGDQFSDQSKTILQWNAFVK